jgi:ribonuclease R
MGDPDNSDAVSSSKQQLNPFAPWCCPTLHQADVINQQVLCSLLNDGKDRPTVRQKTKARLGEKGVAASVSWPLFTASQEQKINDMIRERTVQRLNARRRQAEELRRDVLAMTKARSAEPMLDQQQTGVISGVQSYGFFVEIAPSMVEGLVHVSSLNDDWYEYRSRQNRLVGRRSRRVYQLGDTVEVKVLKVDVLRNQIDLEVVSSTEPVSNDPLPVAVSEE